MRGPARVSAGADGSRHAALPNWGIRATIGNLRPAGSSTWLGAVYDLGTGRVRFLS